MPKPIQGKGCSAVYNSETLKGFAQLRIADFKAMEGTRFSGFSAALWRLGRIKLPHGSFLPWIATEFEMSQPTAFRFMQSAERFGDKLFNLNNLKPAIIYELASLSTPDEVVEQVIEKVRNGYITPRGHLMDLIPIRTCRCTQIASLFLPIKTAPNRKAWEKA